METPVLPTPASHPLWQHQLGLLLESTGEGIFGIDLDGHCMFINRAGAEMLGHERSAVLGRNMHELTHHSHPDGSHYADTDCPIFNAFRRGLPCRIDTEVFWRSDGSAFAVEYSSHPIMDGAQVRGAVITFVDSTERRLTAIALQQAKEQLGLRVEDSYCFQGVAEPGMAVAPSGWATARCGWCRQAVPPARGQRPPRMTARCCRSARMPGTAS